MKCLSLQVTLLFLAFLPFAKGDWKATVANYCLECHDTDVQKGGIDLEIILDSPFHENTDQWEQVLRQVEARQMPPLAADRPDENEYEQLGASLVFRLDELAAKNPNPGRTDSIRRLTRTEYENSIRDLFGIEINARELLPADSSSHGFDNVTVGDLSPALLERYLLAAQKISRQAVGRTSGKIESETIRIRADVTQAGHVSGLPPGTRGGLLTKHNFPGAGNYEIQIHFTRDRNELIEGFDRDQQVEFFLEGERVAGLEVKRPRGVKSHTGHDANLKVVIEAENGLQQLGVTFVAHGNPIAETYRQPYDAQFNLHRHPRREPAIAQITITGPLDTEAESATRSGGKIFSGKSEEGESDSDRARKILLRFAEQAWRGPVSSHDLERCLTFFNQGREDGGSFEAGMERALSAILVSRNFLFRIEKDPKGISPETPYPIEDSELASRLSFFLWSSLPDEPLRELAKEGQLSNPETLRAQVARMLRDGRSNSLVNNFADQWLYLRNLDAVHPDARLFPGFDHNLREAFRRETEWHFERMIREDRSVLDLLQSEETFLNERLAKHYGIPHIYGTRFREVELTPEVNRGGLLRQGSILTVTSYATRTSPVIRGNWILESILGTPPPPPPPNIPTLEEVSVSAELPIRERLAAHREKAACASCHNVMDPIGFALEHYDSIGGWRELENGAPVDARGALPGSDDFDGVEGLERAILQRPERFVSTLAEKLIIFGLGRGITASDGPEIRKIVAQAEKQNYAFSELATAIVQSKLFTMRMSPPR